MDFFGIGQALISGFEIYLRCARGTGRTTNLVDSLDDGDRVICISNKDARQLKELAARRDIRIEVIVSSPSMIHQERMGTSQCRTILDHRFVEQYHRESLKRSVDELNKIELGLSGYGFRHRDTKAKAIELAKWRI